MAASADIDKVRSLVREVIAEANWVAVEASRLESEERDQGLAPEVREICKTIIVTAMYDLRTELDSLAERIADAGKGDPGIPARLILDWLRRDLEPLMALAPYESGPEPEDVSSGLLHTLLWVGAGELAMKFNAIHEELGPLLKEDAVAQAIEA
jgi:hypothetical protein